MGFDHPEKEGKLMKEGLTDVVKLNGLLSLNRNQVNAARNNITLQWEEK